MRTCLTEDPRGGELNDRRGTAAQVSPMRQPSARGILEGMSASDHPQIGAVDVDPAALELAGERLAELADRFGFEVDPAPDAPHGGWRLIAQRDAQVVFGAPVDDATTRWRLASGDARRGGRLSVHPQEMPLRPSRAARGRGLELRWPASANAGERFDPALAAVDVVNAGDARWYPNGDSFYVAGAMARAGKHDGGVSIAYVSGQHGPAFALDPGEYARVRVHLQPQDRREFEPGTYEVHAVLIDLGLWTPEPMRVDLSAADIAANQPAPPPSASSSREQLASRRGMLRVLMNAHERFDELTDIIVESSSDDAACARVEALLDCTPDLAQTVLSTRLLRFGRTQQSRLADELRDLERALESAEDQPFPPH
jgi:hypothetical protein